MWQENSWGNSIDKNAYLVNDIKVLRVRDSNLYVTILVCQKKIHISDSFDLRHQKCDL